MKSLKLQLMTVLAAGFLTSANAQTGVDKLWETTSPVQVPESVLFDGDKKVLYVAQIDGKATEKDGKGGIALVSLDGKDVNADWVTGLNAPKGMGKHKGKLYVADIDEVVVIDIKTGKVDSKIAFPNAKFLNDVSVDKTGNVYVSDMQDQKIYVIKNGVPSVFVDGLQRPNGVLATGKDLLILDAGTVLKVGADKKTVTVAEGLDKSTDGIEEVKPGEYIVSAWAGLLYYVKSNGEVKELLDTRDAGYNAADIGYNAKKKIIYVPTFMKNSVVAYQLR